ncbi:hypothetical protein GCM10028833_32420 [Glycomyces tarimensis]
MTKPYTEWLAERAHKDKKPYPNRKRAKQGARRQALRCGEKLSAWCAYRCPVCPAWHIGHKAVTRA